MNRMEHYLPHEMVLIGCGKRIDSVQPEQIGISRKRKKKRCTPSSCLGGPNGPTEWEEIADYFMSMHTTEDGWGSAWYQFRATLQYIYPLYDMIFPSHLVIFFFAGACDIYHIVLHRYTYTGAFSTM